MGARSGSGSLGAKPCSTSTVFPSVSQMDNRTASRPIGPLNGNTKFTGQGLKVPGLWNRQADPEKAGFGTPPDAIDVRVRPSAPEKELFLGLCSGNQSEVQKIVLRLPKIGSFKMSKKQRFRFYERRGAALEFNAAGTGFECCPRVHGVLLLITKLLREACEKYLGFPPKTCRRVSMEMEYLPKCLVQRGFMVPCSAHGPESDIAVWPYKHRPLPSDFALLGPGATGVHVVTFEYAQPDGDQVDPIAFCELARRIHPGLAV